MTRIANIRGFEFLDSRGNPTLGVDVELDNGCTGSAMVPSGASVGTFEALEVRDQDPNRYHGKGVLGSIRDIRNEFEPPLKKLADPDQSEVDSLLQHIDGSPDKARLGANTALGVSLAFARARAKDLNLPLYRYINTLCDFSDEMRMPVPMFNLLNGGAHANNCIDLQEFMVVPVGTLDIASAVRCGSEIFHCLKNLMDSIGFSTSVGDEGGFAPDLRSDSDALDLLSEAVIEAEYDLGTDVAFALDCAASEFFNSGRYVLQGQNRTLDAKGLIDYLESLIERFPIVSLEDGLNDQDWNSWQELTARLGDRVQLVGDDLFVTNEKFLNKGIESKVANAILIKLNQIGTLTETLEVMAEAKKAGYNTVVSHRSGDTEDPFIADLAVGACAGQIKTGSVCRSERTSKYNRLIRIEAEAGLTNFRGVREFD